MTGLVAVVSAGIAAVATQMTTTEIGTLIQKAHRHVR